VGISVSRVGGSAQTKAMKQVAGSLRLDLASYRELQAFTQFGSDLDKATQNQLNRGARMTELLKQGRYNPMPFEEQALAIYNGNQGYLDDIAVVDVMRFRDEMLAYVRTSRPDVYAHLREEKKWTDAIKAEANEAIEAFKKSFAPSAQA
jgi:F-type H+-transporting ATPase subunit alpha